MRPGPGHSERWFNRALWLVALVFAFFLIGLGSLLVGDLPQVEQSYIPEAFPDRERVGPSVEALRQLCRDQEDNQRRTEQAGLELEAARSASAAARETFVNWLRTPDATQRVDQDPGLVARTEQLDALKGAERAIETRLEGLARAGLDLSERLTAQEGIERAIRADAGAKYAAALNGQELRVFAYRLALTLPLLAPAGWLLASNRASRNWPFVWGFAFFAAFTFFVELVPYLPRWGGCVLNAVGIVATLIAGRAAINGSQAYLARQKEAEARPDQERRVEIVTDQALVRLAERVCPRCDHRKSTFDRFCHACRDRPLAPAGAGRDAAAPGPEQAPA